MLTDQCRRVMSGITTCSREPSGSIASTNGVLRSTRRPVVLSIRSTRSRTWPSVEDRRGQLGPAAPGDEHPARLVDPDLLDRRVVEVALQRAEAGDRVVHRRGSAGRGRPAAAASRSAPARRSRATTSSTSRRTASRSATGSSPRRRTSSRTSASTVSTAPIPPPPSDPGWGRADGNGCPAPPEVLPQICGHGPRRPVSAVVRAGPPAARHAAPAADVWGSASEASPVTCRHVGSRRRE